MKKRVAGGSISETFCPQTGQYAIELDDPHKTRVVFALGQDAIDAGTSMILGGIRAGMMDGSVGMEKYDDVGDFLDELISNVAEKLNDAVAEDDDDFIAHTFEDHLDAARQDKLDVVFQDHVRASDGERATKKAKVDKPLEEVKEEDDEDDEDASK